MASPNANGSEPVDASRMPFGQDYHSGSLRTEATEANDVEDVRTSTQDDNHVFDSDSEFDDSAVIYQQKGRKDSMIDSYRRPSFSIAGSRATANATLPSSQRDPTESEKRVARCEERNLLRDNNVIPPGRPQTSRAHGSLMGILTKQLGSGLSGENRENSKGSPRDEEAVFPIAREGVSETTSLLRKSTEENERENSSERLDKQWTQAVAAGKIHTTWQREAKVLSRYSAPLILTFLLQYSLTVASIVTVGRLGRAELGATSLASMTANITGYAVYQGLATSLDTLCSQAYGSGNKQLVGLQTQRMVFFLWLITVPIAVIWFSASSILMLIVPEHDVARLAGLYLKVVLIGAPGYACFESTKRYLQAQGLFSASLYVLLICSPLNAFMNWLFVWQFKWGFIGAPIAVAVTDCLLPILLIGYIYFIAGSACWPGLTSRAFKNWGPMIRLALPGLVMVEAEVLAFEILTLASSYFGTTHLAAQSVLGTISAITFQIPFPISIAASTRIANLIGASLANEARTTAKVAFAASTGVGVMNVVLLSSLRSYIPLLFTNDPSVIALVAGVLPLCAAFQLFDSLACCCNGVLRGLGRQDIGGWVSLFCYYAVAMPVSMGTAFGVGWKLYGLWSGVAVALAMVAAVEGVFLWRARWERSVEDAERRNAGA
ncbi:MAG: hypothetical protein Q9174_000614 [Haloplaca sp. 1 TL-2023]